MLQKEVIEVGQRIASDLIDAQLSKSMGSVSGRIIEDISEYDNSDLIQKYLDDEIVSVEAIYIAMKRVEALKPSHNNAMMPCNQYMKQSSTVSVCPIGHFNCGASPCMVARHQ